MLTREFESKAGLPGQAHEAKGFEFNQMNAIILFIVSFNSLMIMIRR